MAPGRGLMIVLDGLGDRPCPELAGRTPLEAAATPHLDRLAASGQVGLMDPLAPGLPVATDFGVGLLLGYPPGLGPPQRGPVEAAGCGLLLAADEVAWRCNLVTVAACDGGGWALLDRRAGRIGPPDSTVLASALQEGLRPPPGVRLRVVAATGYRLVLVLGGEEVCHQVSDADPGSGREGRGVAAVVPLTSSAAATARLLNDLLRQAHALLADHPVNRRRLAAGQAPANLILPRRGGRWRPVRGLLEHLGVRGAVVAGERTVLGLARLLGLTPITEPGFSGLTETDLAGKVAAAEAALGEYDLVFLHIKGPDLQGHDRAAGAKRDLLAAIDRACAPLLTTERWAVAVTGDHSTPCATGRHSGDPVPVLLAAPGGRREGRAGFGEGTCGGGSLGRITANGLLWSLLDQMGVVAVCREGDLPYLVPPAMRWPEEGG